MLPELDAFQIRAERLSFIIDGRPQLRESNQIMAELVAMALACDQTRVFSHWFCDPVNDLLFPEASAGHHDLTHNEGGDQPQVQANTVFCMEAFGDFMRTVPEGKTPARISSNEGPSVWVPPVFLTSASPVGSTNERGPAPLRNRLYLLIHQPR